MRILSILPGSSNPTSMIFARRQVEAISREGVENHSYYIKSRTSFAGVVRAFFEIRKAIHHVNPDVIHAHYGTMTAFLSAYTHRRPVVITFHGSDVLYTPSDGVFRDFFGRILSNLAALRADAIICVSEKVKDNLWWRKSKVEIISAGINLDVFAPVEKFDARHQLAWNDDDFVVLFNNNNPLIKRLDIAEKTLALVKKSFSRARLEVISHVDPSQLPLYLSASDCLLLCSDSEGSPTIVKEALACDLSVVSTPVGDVAATLHGVRNCFIARQDPEELCKAIIPLIPNRERSDGRRKIISMGLSDADVAKKVIHLYDECLKERNNK